MMGEDSRPGTRRPRVLVTASTFPRWTGDTLPTFVLDQVTRLSREHPELRFHLLAPHDPGAAKLERMGRIVVHRFQYCWPESFQRLVYPSILPNLTARRWLLAQVPFLFFFEFLATWRLSRRLSPIHLYSHWFCPQGVTTGLVGLLLRIPHSCTSHAVDVEVMWKLPWLGRRIVRGLVRRMEAVHVVSEPCRERLRAFFDEEEWLDVSRAVLRAPMGVDVEAIGRRSGPVEELKERHGLAQRTVILFLGRLVPKKGVAHLVSAFAGLAAEREGLELVIAGDGPEAADLRKEAAASGVGDRIRFFGHVQGDRKRELLQLCDMLVIPSVVTHDGDAEGLPVVLLEGLATGRICLTTEASGASDVLTNGRDGFLLGSASSAALAAGMERILAFTDTERHRVSGEARLTAARYDWSELTPLYFDHLLGDKSSDARPSKSRAP